MKSRSRGKATRVLLSAALAAGALAGASAVPHGAYAAPASITLNRSNSTLTLRNHNLSMVYDYDHQAVVSSLALGNTQLLDAGMYSTAILDGDGSTLSSKTLAASPSVKVHGHTVTTSFTMANDAVSLRETWTFTLTNDTIRLGVQRTYDWLDTTNTSVRHNGMLSIGWGRVWDNVRRPADGGDLPIGNAYTGENNFFLSEPNDRYGVEESDFVMLKNSTKQALDVSASSSRNLATEFAYTGDGNTYQETQVSSAASWDYTAGTKAQGYVYGGHSSNATSAYIYAPVATTQKQTDSVTYTFAPDNYAKYYSLGGTVKGVDDPAALSSMLNDFGRSGVIDKGYGMSTVGLRYPGVGPYDMVYADRTVEGYFDPAMTQSQENLLSYFRDYAQNSSGHMDGRTYHLDHPWGDDNLYDADPSYASAVADMYQYSSDSAWLASMRTSVESSLGYMINNEFDQTDSLFHNDINTCTSSKSIREWNDALYIKWESGYINELMYQALTQWSQLERDVFHDDAQATTYASLATALKTQFNKDAADGGLWDPSTGMFAYWRCPDGTVHGNVEQTQINLQAISFGMVDLSRAKQILDGIDKDMQRYHLSMVPENFAPLTLTTLDWSGDHFSQGIEDGSVYPLMTEEYMRAAAMVGERDRSLTYLNNTVDRYTQDGFNGFSFLDWTLQPHGGEAWFPSNANGAAGLFSDVLGIQPTGTGVTIAPNIPSAMNGTTVTKTIHGTDSLTVDYRNELTEVVNYSAKKQPVTLQWSGQTPSSTYTVVDNGRKHQVSADSFGIVRYTYTGKGQHTVTLDRGSANGYVLPDQVPTDLALNKPVTTSSSREDADWGAANVVDGQPFSVDGSYGWSSDSNPTVNHTESMTVDLGKKQTVGAVTLWPRDWDGKPSDLADDFPIDFTIAVSADGTNWTTVADESNYPKPSDGSAQTFSFDQQQARYVRVEGTNLRKDSDTNDGTTDYKMELAEVEVFSTTPPPATKPGT
ncbi:hypothetical protein GCM10023322_43450 [Rugosimonospora acidiphila]|uniref:F5/8 type C domain-containing protein n=1 Tax=Rugosimonospora acidiphila TaxID=556531 RepID=A0ABP9S1Z8_9ACTN